MKSVRIIFIAMEIAMLIGVVLFTLGPDWTKAEQEGSAWMYQAMIILCSFDAVIFHHEQQEAKWTDREDAE